MEDAPQDLDIFQLKCGSNPGESDCRSILCPLVTYGLIVIASSEQKEKEDI